MTIKDDILQAVITAVNDDSLAEVEGLVYQCWEDGEVTLQKCGSLLGQRRLHMVRFACIAPLNGVLSLNWPHRNTSHAFVYCTAEGAETLRQALIAYAD